MKYVIRAIEYQKTVPEQVFKFLIKRESLYTNLKKAVIDAGLNYGTFNNWKSKNNIDFPIEYRGFLFEKVEVK